MKHKYNHDRGFFKACFRWFLKITGFVPTFLFYFKPKIKYEGKKPKIKKSIIVSNHTNILDPILILSRYWYKFIRPVVSELIYNWNKPTKFFVKILGSVKVDRFVSNPEFINACIDTLDRNGNILIFPEGRINKKNDNELLPFSVSTIVIAIKSNAKIIPCYHDNRYGLFKRTKLVIGNPIDPSSFNLSQNPSIEELQKASDILRDKINYLKTLI